MTSKKLIHNHKYTYKRIGLVVLLLSGLLGCKSYNTTSNRVFVPIQTRPGPEDIALYSFKNDTFIIASCAERRLENPDSWFYGINTKNNTSEEMKIEGLPDSLHLDLHGIDIETINKKTWMYAIDHHQTSKWHQIIRFKLKGMVLVFDTIYTSSEYLINPNDLDVDNKGNIYVSNSMGRGSVFLQYLLNQKKSSIVKYDVNKKKWQFLIKKLSYANGIAITDSTLFIATTRMKGLYSYSNELLYNRSEIIKGKKGRRIAKIKGLDNLIIDEGLLYTTAHPDVLKFLSHAKHKEKISPSQVWEVNPKTSESKLLYQSSGKEISGSSTALPLKNKIYISQIFEPFIGFVER